MNIQHKAGLEVAGLIASIFAIFWLLHSRNSATAAALAASVPNPELSLESGSDPSQWTAPDYITFNVPKTIPDVSVPAVTTTANTGSVAVGTCGCSDLDNSTLFASTSALAASYADQLQGLASTYSANLESALPGFIKQFLNNPGGVSDLQQFNQTIASWQGG